MIELKNVTTCTPEGDEGLKCYSRIIRNGELCLLPHDEGEFVVGALLGFHPVRSGIISIDGMPLTERSVSFLRKLMAYVPSPEGFENVVDVAEKQRRMIDDAMSSEGDILLAVTPTSHQDELQAMNIMNLLRQRTANNRIVIITE